MFSTVVQLQTLTVILTEVLTLTILALVTQKPWWTAAGWLVAQVDGAVASIVAVVFTNVQVTSGPREASLTAAGRSSSAGRGAGSSVLTVVSALVDFTAFSTVTGGTATFGVL